MASKVDLQQKSDDINGFPTAIQKFIKASFSGRLALVHPGRAGQPPKDGRYRWFCMVYPAWMPIKVNRRWKRRAERIGWEILVWPSFFGSFETIVGYDLSAEDHQDLPSVASTLTLERIAALGLGQDWEPNPPATVTEFSGNRKTGQISNTFTSQAGCPSACPHFQNGCYAEHGPNWYVTRRQNASPVRDPVEIAAAEAALIDRLPAVVDLRLNEVGDHATEAAVRIRSDACVRFERRSPNGSRAFGYTHAWRTVPIEAHQGISILASCESADDVRHAQARGYATSLVVPEFMREQVYEQDGIRILPCPNETRGVQCVTCRLCMRGDKLREQKLTIAFSPHGSGQKMLRGTLLGRK